jgi:hypothetical protein
MPQSRIELEYVNGRWVGEVEFANTVFARRRVIRGDTLPDAIRAIVNAYDEMAQAKVSDELFGVRNKTAPDSYGPPQLVQDSAYRGGGPKPGASLRNQKAPGAE